MASPSGSVAEIRKSMGSPTNTVLSATGVSEGGAPLSPAGSFGQQEQMKAIPSAPATIVNPDAIVDCLII